MYSRRTFHAATTVALLILISATANTYGQEPAETIASRVKPVSESALSSAETAGTGTSVIEQLTREAESAPDNWQVQNKLAVEYTKIGENDLALPLLDTAIGLEPENAYLYYNAAVVYERLHRTDDALSSVRRSLSLDATVPGARRMECDLQLELSKFRDSVKCYEALSSNKPADAQFYASYAYSLAYAGDLKRAAKVLEEALNKYPESADLLNARGIVSCVKKDYRHAIEDFRRLILLDPNFDNARLNLGLAALMNNDRATAFDQYQILKASDPALAQQLRDALDKRYIVSIGDSGKSKSALK